MHTRRYTLPPFEQFAVNASGTPVGQDALAGFPYASLGIPTSAGLPVGGGALGDGFSGIEDPTAAYGLLVLGAAGMGAAVAQWNAKRPNRYGAAAGGALVQGGAAAVVAGIFGSALSTPARVMFSTLGLGLLAGSFITSRR